MYTWIYCRTYGYLHHRAEARAKRAEITRIMREPHMYAIVMEALMVGEKELV